MHVAVRVWQFANQYYPLVIDSNLLEKFVVECGILLFLLHLTFHSCRLWGFFVETCCLKTRRGWQSSLKLLFHCLPRRNHSATRQITNQESNRVCSTRYLTAQPPSSLWQVIRPNHQRKRRACDGPQKTRTRTRHDPGRSSISPPSNYCVPTETDL